MNSNTALQNYRPFLFAFIILTPFLFFIGGPEQYSPRSIKHAWNLGHIVYYALLPAAFITCIKGEELNAWLQIGISFGLAAVLGTAMEIFQSAFGRHFDLYDLARNMTGALVATSFILPVSRKLPIIIKLMAIALALAQLYPVTISLIDEHHARRKFPLLSDFQTPFQVHRWQGDGAISVVNDSTTDGNRVLKADLPTIQYPGANMKHFPPDWRNYNRFQFRIFNPAPKPLPVTCRIHDEAHTKGTQHYHDRYNRVFRINPGWNTVTINLKDVSRAPKDRLMDLSRIRGIVIFTTRPTNPLTIYIDDLKLF